MLPSSLLANSSVETLLDSATTAFSPVSDSPEADAQWLLADALGMAQSELRNLRVRLPSAAQLRQFQNYCERRLAGEPVAYILGEWDFWSLTLKLSPAVLIPRPETELLVEYVLEKTSALAGPCILDLGTGSGAIALAVASERPSASITATDASPDALAVAIQNAARLGFDNVHFLQSDWLTELDTQQFDLIASNPPYVDPADPCLKRLTHEPINALTAAQQGYADIEKIALQAPKHLRDSGWLLVEHGASQGEKVRALFTQNGFSGVATIPDYAGLDRICIGQWRSNKSAKHALNIAPQSE